MVFGSKIRSVLTAACAGDARKTADLIAHHIALDIVSDNQDRLRGGGR